MLLHMDALKQIYTLFFCRNVNFRPTSRGLHEIHALVPPVSLPESRDAVWSGFSCNWILLSVCRWVFSVVHVIISILRLLHVPCMRDTCPCVCKYVVLSNTDLNIIRSLNAHIWPAGTGTSILLLLSSCTQQAHPVYVAL